MLECSNALSFSQTRRFSVEDNCHKFIFILLFLLAGAFGGPGKHSRIEIAGKPSETMRSLE